MENKKIKILTVVGTRPEVIRLSETLKELDKGANHVLVHTGQNYDFELNEIFFSELGLRKPDYFLNSTKTSVVETVGSILSEVDKILEKEKPDAFLVLGDTNSCLSAYAAKRRRIPVFHMEAGNRCFDLRVPEEVNRKVIDHLSDINLVYSDLARGNLVREGISPERIIKTGSPIFEVIETHKDSINESNVLEELDLEKGKYFLVSTHREENVDDIDRLKLIFRTLECLVDKYELPVIISTHPRTKKRIDEGNIKVSKNIKFMKPFGFFDYVKLQKDSLCTISDSGTINEEAAALGFSAVNLRESHERPEAMDETVTIMAGLDQERVLQAIDVTLQQKSEQNVRFRMPDGYEDRNVSKKIIRIIVSYTDYVERVNGWK